MHRVSCVAHSGNKNQISATTSSRNLRYFNSLCVTFVPIVIHSIDGFISEEGANFFERQTLCFWAGRPDDRYT